jgi:hypothetical protein
MTSMSDQRGDLVHQMLRAIRGDLAEVKVDLVELGIAALSQGL